MIADCHGIGHSGCGLCAACRPTSILDGPATLAIADVRTAIEAVFREEIVAQSRRLGITPSHAETPGGWINRVRKAALLAAVATAPELLI